MRARPLLPVLLALAAVLAAAPARPAAAGTRLAERQAQGGPRVASRHAILVDADGGAVLWGRGSRAPRPPASLTKMLTALAVRASLDLDEQVTASRAAAGQPARRLAVRRGQRLTVEQALKALLIVSANDVAVMLAEGDAGSVGRFARAMDAESERLGLRHSRWRNPHGLDAPATAPAPSTSPSWQGRCSATGGSPRWSACAGPPSPARAGAATRSPRARGSCSATRARSASRPA
jgi:D-alanyl-D-alanine carboxypeptidase